MGMRQLLLALLAVFISQSLLGKDIVVGVRPIPIRKMAFIFTPVVLPDLISAKAAFEYRLHRKFNLVIPLESKWMDYRRAIKLGARMVNAQQQDLPESIYYRNQTFRPLWNIDILQFKISSGIGAKWFPFSESMTNAFFLKSLFMVGYEHFNAYGAEGKKDDAVFTSVVTVGYNWVKRNGFTFGLEGGGEYTWHTDPIKNLPILLDGFMPVFQFSLGFAI